MGLDLALVGLFTAQLFANSVYSVIAPFFPEVAEEKGVTSKMIGIIFSMYPVAAFMTSPILGMFISKIGRKRTLLSGGLLIVRTIQALTMFGFGSLPLLPGLTFTASAMGSRFLQGVGGAVIGTAGYAIIASSYPDNMEVVLGVQNSIAGLGMMIGPLLGSLLYWLGGFMFLFFIYGALFLAFLPVSYILIPKDKPYVKPVKEVQLTVLILDPVILLDGFVVVLSMITITFLEPVFADHLSSYEVSIELIGVMFTIPTVSYAVTVYLLGKMPENIERKAIMMAGLIIAAGSLLLLGPWTYLHLPRSLWVVSLGLVLLGVGIAFCICISYLVPVLPDMVKAAQQALPESVPEHVSDATSGLMTSYFFLGEIVGPPLAGVLKDWKGFEHAAAIISGLLIVYIVIFGIGVRCLPDRRIKDSGLKTRLQSEEEMVTSASLIGKEEEFV